MSWQREKQKIKRGHLFVFRISKLRDIVVDFQPDVRLPVLAERIEATLQVFVDYIPRVFTLRLRHPCSILPVSRGIIDRH